MYVGVEAILEFCTTNQKVSVTLVHSLLPKQNSWEGAKKKQRETLLDLIRRLAEDDKDGVMAQKVLTLLWNLAHSPDASTEIMEQALSAHKKVGFVVTAVEFEWCVRHDIHIEYGSRAQRPFAISLIFLGPTKIKACFWKNTTKSVKENAKPLVGGYKTNHDFYSVISETFGQDCSICIQIIISLERRMRYTRKSFAIESQSLKNSHSRTAVRFGAAVAESSFSVIGVRVLCAILSMLYNFNRTQNFLGPNRVWGFSIGALAQGEACIIEGRSKIPNRAR